MAFVTNCNTDDLVGYTGIQYGYWEDYQIVDSGDTSPVQFGRFLDELGAEFCTENYRRRDLIRFDVYTKKSWLSHKPKGDHRSIFPIPKIAMDANPNLVQNNGYN